MYRLIAIDLDGTLLDSTGQVPQKVAEAMKRAADAGMIVAPATARWYQAAIRPFVAMGIQPAAIASAGADVRLHTGEPVAQHRLPQEFGRFVAELCDRAGWPATLAVPHKAYRRANELPVWAANAPEWLQPVTSLTEVDLSDLLAVLAEAPPEDPALAELLQWGDRVALFDAISFAGDGMVTATAKGVDKGTALIELCEALGVEPTAAVAIGDSEVDIPMLRAAGLSVAVETGTPETLAAAERVIPGPDAGGIADFIDWLLDS